MLLNQSKRKKQQQQQRLKRYEEPTGMSP